jgi:hypothetical protein
VLPTASADHYRLQQRLGAVTASGTRILWARMNEDFDTSWARIESRVLQLVTSGQEAAARTGAAHLERVLYETGQVDLPAGDVQAGAFSGTASDGRSLPGLLRTAVTTSKIAVGSGATVDDALAQGGRQLTMTVLTAVADANREAVHAGIGQRPHVGGWVRMLNGPSCRRCVILAGKWFRWNEGFQRHPRCDCRHIPSSEQLAGDLSTDPYEFFRSLSPADQEKTFGRIEARAIRDGADIYRTVNLQARGLGTARANRRYGTPSRRTIDDIYRTAGTRTNAIRMMTDEGYITGPQVGGGNILGQREGFGQLGRGGTRIGASQSVLNARASGVRDRLDRATMTAAERRLYDAHTMAQSVAEGRSPWIRGRAVTDDERALAARILQKQLDDLGNQPRQVHELAQALGLTA